MSADRPNLFMPVLRTVHEQEAWMDQWCRTLQFLSRNVTRPTGGLRAVGDA